MRSDCSRQTQFPKRKAPNRTRPKPGFRESCCCILFGQGTFELAWNLAQNRLWNLKRHTKTTSRLEWNSSHAGELIPQCGDPFCKCIHIYIYKPPALTIRSGTDPCVGDAYSYLIFSCLKAIYYFNPFEENSLSEQELNVCNGFSCRNNYRLPEDVSFSGVFERNLPCSGTCAELESKFKFPLLLRNRLNMDRCVWFFLRNPSSVH